MDSCYIAENAHIPGSTHNDYLSNDKVGGSDIVLVPAATWDAPVLGADSWVRVAHHVLWLNVASVRWEVVHTVGDMVVTDDIGFAVDKARGVGVEVVKMGPQRCARCWEVVVDMMASDLVKVQEGATVEIG